MPKVPGDNVVQMPQAQPMPDPTLLLMAAATMHEQGRLFEDSTASDEYIQNIEKRPGVFEPERFHSKLQHPLTEAARDATMQIARGYNSGDPDIVEAVDKYEKADKTPYEYSSRAGGKLTKSAAWNIFYQAQTRYIGDALSEEAPISLSNKQREELETWHEFDLGGRAKFDFHSLISKDKLRLKSVK